jgi:hypothetical protein
MNLKVEQDSKMFQDSCQIEIKFFFQDPNISRSSLLDLSLNASQKFQTLKFFPRYIFLSNLTRPKIILKNSDDKDDDDDDDEMSQIILINKFVKLCKFTSQSV